MTMNQVEYAAHRGVKKQYINRLVSTGVIPVDSNKKIAPAVADAILDARADPSREGVVRANAERYGKPLNPALQQSIPMHPDEAAIMAGLPRIPAANTDAPLKFADVRTRREQALAETAEFELAKMREQYVERSAAGSMAKAAGKAWRNLLTEVQATLPSMLIGVVKQHVGGKVDPDVYQLIEHGFRSMVTEAHRTALKQVADEVERMGRVVDAVDDARNAVKN